MWPPVTRALIIATVGVFLLQMAGADSLPMNFALWPLGPMFEPWQLFSYAFLHANIAHVLFNMWGLYLFGADLERLWGAWRFAAYFLICVLSAGIAQLALTALTGQSYPTIGASGGVFGLLLAFAIYFPTRTIVPLFPPIPMPAWLFALIYGGLELVLGVSGTQAGVAHFAHLGGMLGGLVVIYGLWGRRLRFR